MEKISVIKSFFGRKWAWIGLICVLVIGFIFYLQTGKSARGDGQGSGQDRKARMPAFPVAAAEVKKMNFGVYITGLGTVTPLQTVTVRTRVDGELMNVLFREGQQVRRGELLAKIDPRPFEVQLTQAEGMLVKDMALLKNAQLDVERYRVLWKQDSIPKQQLDTQEYLVTQYEGAVKTDQGQIDNAKLQIIYCHVTSPLDGLVGLRLVDSGNIVHATDANGLAVITQLQPITVIFPIPEDYIPRVFPRLKKGERLTVEAYDREANKKLAEGVLLTSDNQVDTTTGTVRLKAIFPNKDFALFPNQFVNARLLLNTRRDATVILSSAIQRGPRRHVCVRGQK